MVLPLTQGKVAVVDNSLKSREAAQFKWHAFRCRRRWYAVRNVYTGLGRRRLCYLHRFLLDAPARSQVDHIDGDGLNNRLSNLRFVSFAQNMQGYQRLRLNKASKFRGVTWNARAGKWQAQIGEAGRVHYLGVFNNERQAAEAYNRSAKQRFGKFAQQNEIS